MGKPFEGMDWYEASSAKEAKAKAWEADTMQTLRRLTGLQYSMFAVVLLLMHCHAEQAQGHGPVATHSTWVRHPEISNGFRRLGECAP